MDAIAIVKLLQRFPCFKGVFALDKISQNCKNGSFIINTDPSTKPGEHWVAVVIKKGIGEYFDSFGNPPYHREILNFLERNCSHNWWYNPLCIQNTFSTTCGHYCILYVGLRCLGYSYNHFVSKFTGNTESNDDLVEKVFGFYPL